MEQHRMPHPEGIFQRWLGKLQDGNELLVRIGLMAGLAMLLLIGTHE